MVLKLKIFTGPLNSCFERCIGLGSSSIVKEKYEKYENTKYENLVFRVGQRNSTKYEVLRISYSLPGNTKQKKKIFFAKFFFGESENLVFRIFRQRWKTTLNLSFPYSIIHLYICSLIHRRYYHKYHIVFCIRLVLIVTNASRFISQTVSFFAV